MEGIVWFDLIWNVIDILSTLSPSYFILHEVPLLILLPQALLRREISTSPTALAPDGTVKWGPISVCWANLGFPNPEGSSPNVSWNSMPITTTQTREQGTK